MSENLKIYNAVRIVPKEAQKPIGGGRLKGMTDINPMWRLKMLTEQFGPCGIGWKYEIVEERLEKGGNDEIAAFIKINLYYKYNGEWSEPIPGTGGNMFVTKESRGLYTSDECFKMALTDALSVACKALGFGADVYWEKDKTKYSKPTSGTPTEDKPKSIGAITDKQISRAYAIAKSNNLTEDAIKKWIKGKYNKDSLKDLTKAEYDALCEALEKAKEAS